MYTCRYQSLGKGHQPVDAVLPSDLQTISTSLTCLNTFFKLLDHILGIHFVDLSVSESNAYTYLETVAHKDHPGCQGPGVSKLTWHRVAPLSH